MNFLFLGMIGTLVDIIIPRPNQNGEQIPGVGKVFRYNLLHVFFGFCLALACILFLSLISFSIHDFLILRLHLKYYDLYTDDEIFIRYFWDKHFLI